MNLNINIAIVKMEYSWNHVWHEIRVHLKFECTWHQIIEQLEEHLVQNWTAIKLYFNRCTHLSTFKNEYD